MPRLIKTLLAMVGAVFIFTSGVTIAASQDVNRCLDRAYSQCKNDACKKRNRYCTGYPADIEASPCYTNAAAACRPQKARECRNSAYKTCKNQECYNNSRYCTGRPADIEASLCYSQKLQRCLRN